ncbi:MAG TPA: serine/threonine-protein kinase [Labilithrix sp.]|nr:serine/threonine-protein kinase [Labilithrix sp.]
MTALSRANLEEGPGPLEGLHPDVIVRAVSAALQAGLADNLDWLSPAAAGVALYTLATALPVGTEQRELGRRVLSRMLAGNAETFTAIATSMAQSAGKGLSSPNVRARIALVTEIPLVHGIADGPLALALVSRREFQRDWVSVPSTGSLPARRLVAKLLERAAREAARRAQMGDTHSMRVFLGERVREAHHRLLEERESLVWRYVAVARGLCAGWIPEFKEQILDGLREGLSPTEWRRAAASLAALGAVRPDEALKITTGIVKRGLFSREDPGSAAAFLWGIPRTIEAEPETATKMLDLVLLGASPEVAEAVLELRYEYGPSRAVDRAFRQAHDLCRSTRAKPKGEDDGADALYHEVARDLEPGPRDDQPVRGQVFAALEAFITDGAAVAYQRAREVLSAATGGMDALEAVAKDDDAEGRTGSLARRTSMAVMRDLDASLLERPVIADLLKLGASAEARASEEALDAIRERFAEWIVACESPEETSAMNGEASTGAPRHPTLRLRRLRALLHLVDGDLGDALDGGATGKNASDASDAVRGKRLRALWLRTVKALLEHFETDPSPVLKRTLLASLARALDALVRLGACDVADALLVLAMRISSRRDFETLAEASMDPDLRHVLARYAQFLKESEPTLEVSSTASESSDSARPPENTGADPRLKALESLADELAQEGSSRSEALRTVLIRIHGALTTVSKVIALSALSTSNTSDADVVSAVETWVGALAQMILGARRRLDPDAVEAAPRSEVEWRRPSGTLAIQPRLVSILISRVLAEAEAVLDEEELGKAVTELVSGIPRGVGRIVSGLLWNLADLPTERPSAEVGVLAVAEQLPPWLPARRTIGGFYVQRALGVGGTASVFIVTRTEDKQDSNAERFALKVPDYNATAARSLSQEEFFKMFREEASALIMLPNHANLARFVTFDMGTKPLPILVMELVEGVTLERVIQSRTFDMKRCLKVLDDVLAGLEAMHSVGLGHLDLKPSNVLLRRGEQGVLVDFGLAGRKLRQGCGTGPYGAPEVWGMLPEGFMPSPAAADIYSFGCIAFEMLTGNVLFDAPNEVAQITMHVSHDGFPQPMKELIQNPEVGPLAEILVPTLRRDPRHRPSAEELRSDLRAVASMVEEAKWPAALGGRR